MRVSLAVSLALASAACGSSEVANTCAETVAQVLPDWSVIQLAVEGTTLYVGSFDDEGPDDRLAIVDVAEPSTPNVLATIMVDGLWGELVTAGDRLYVGSGHVIDVADPAAPAMIAMIPPWTAMAPHAGHFVQTRNGSLFVVDLQDPMAPIDLGILADTDLEDLAVVGDEAFLIRQPSVALQEALVVAGLGSVSAPVRLGEMPLPNAAFLTADAEHVYAGTITGPLGSEDEQGLFVIDARDPSMPSVIGHAVERNWGPYALLGTLLLTVDHIIDVTDSTAPRILGAPPLPRVAEGYSPARFTVAGTGSTGYWGTNRGVFVVDIACP